MEALRIDPEYFEAWSNLGCDMASGDVVVINGVDYTNKACYVEALRVHPTFVEAWNNLPYSVPDAPLPLSSCVPETQKILWLGLNNILTTACSLKFSESKKVVACDWGLLSA